jgi:hypothetical protein
MFPKAMIQSLEHASGNSDSKDLEAKSVGILYQYCVVVLTVAARVSQLSVYFHGFVTKDWA